MLPRFFGSKAELKAGRPYWWPKVLMNDGVPERNYIAVIWAVITPSGRFRKNGFFIRAFYDTSKALTKEQMFAEAQSRLISRELPRLCRGYSYDGPYLYSMSPELDK